MRTTRLLLSLAWLLFGARVTSSAAEPPGVKLSVDCPFCGPGQVFPHDCPRAPSAPLPLAASDSTPKLLEAARDHHRLLSAVQGLSLPPLGEPKTLAALETELSTQLAAARSEIASLEREQTSITRRVAHATAEAQRLAAQALQLTEQIALAQRQLAASAQPVLEAQQAAVSARESFVAGQKTTTDLREQIRQTRNRLFPRLEQAARRGWILPPSGYRDLPAPLPVKTNASLVNRKSLAPSPTAEATTRTTTTGVQLRKAEQRPFNPATARGGFLGSDAEQRVSAKLNELAALYSRASAAAAVRAETLRTGEASQLDSAAHAARIAALEPAYAAVTAQLAEQQRRLAHNQQAAHEEAARLAEARQRVVATWIEAGLYQFLDHKAAALLAPADAPAPDAARLQALREIATAVAALGVDPGIAIAHFPAVLAAHGESLDAVRRELTAVRKSLGFTVDLATSDDYATAWQPYLQEPRP